MDEAGVVRVARCQVEGRRVEGEKKVVENVEQNENRFGKRTGSAAAFLALLKLAPQQRGQKHSTSDALRSHLESVCRRTMSKQLRCDPSTNEN